MNSFWRIFSLELKSAVRSKSLLMLMIVSVAWMFAAPFLFTGDGTADGARTLAVHYSLGGVAALLSITLLASATGSIASERASGRLQMTLVRPVRRTVVALARISALAAIGAGVLAVAAVVEAVRGDLARPCRHVLPPAMPSPREEAAMMYDVFMSDPSTPEAVRKAKKSVVLRLLAQRSFDRYDTVAANDAVGWSFKLRNCSMPEEGLSVRLRFTNAYDVRDNVRGSLRLVCGDAGWTAAIPHLTQAVGDSPLTRVECGDASSDAASAAELSFRNEGTSALMLRPRRDVNLLVPADGFGWNLVRAYVELVAMLTLLIAFGVFLGSGLGRPVALFTAIVALAVSEMSPSVIEPYPDELETDQVDAVGLFITRAAAEATHPISALEPLARLSEDACVEWREVVRTVIADMAIAPLLLALLAALAMPRKVEPQG